MSNGINNIVKFNIVAACLMSSYMIVRRFLFYTSAHTIIRVIVRGYVDVKRVNSGKKEKTSMSENTDVCRFCLAYYLYNYRRLPNQGILRAFHQLQQRKITYPSFYQSS